MKSLVGGDLLEAEAKDNNQRRTIYGNFNIVITSNSRLHVFLEGDRSAWERRLLIVRYNMPFQGQKISDIDKYLLEREPSGILNWCLKGLELLLEDYNRTGDIILTPEQKEQVNNLLMESDSLHLFVANEIVRDNGRNHFGKKFGVSAHQQRID